MIKILLLQSKAVFENNNNNNNNKNNNNHHHHHLTKRKSKTDIKKERGMPSQEDGKYKKAIILTSGLLFYYCHHVCTHALDISKLFSNLKPQCFHNSLIPHSIILSDLDLGPGFYWSTQTAPNYLRRDSSYRADNHF